MRSIFLFPALLSFCVALGAETKPLHPVHAAVKGRAVYARCRNRGTIRIIDKEQDFRLGVNVEVHADEEGYLKIRATKAAFQAFVILMGPRGVEFYLPRERKLFEGTSAQFARGLGLFSPREMLNLILRGHQSYLEREWLAHGRDEKGHAVYSLKTDPGEDTVHVTLDRKKGRLIKVQAFVEDGTIVREIHYDDYLRVKVEKEVKLFPRTIRMVWPTIDRKITVSMRGVDDDPKVDKNTWTIPLAADTKRLPLSKLSMEGDEKLPEE